MTEQEHEKHLIITSLSEKAFPGSKQHFKKDQSALGWDTLGLNVPPVQTHSKEQPVRTDRTSNTTEWKSVKRSLLVILEIVLCIKEQLWLCCRLWIYNLRIGGLTCDSNSQHAEVSLGKTLDAFLVTHRTARNLNHANKFFRKASQISQKSFYTRIRCFFSDVSI